MKNLILTTSMFALFLLGCGGNAEQQAQEEAEAAQLQEEIETIDSLSTELETLKNDIEESSENLDELLNEL